MKLSNSILFKNDTIGEIKGYYDENGNPWFQASKVCDCLKIKNSSDSLRLIKEKHSRYGDKIEGVEIVYPLFKTEGGKQKVALITENILYELIFQSRTEKAFLFQQWVFKEVLPTLRKTGEYRMQGKLIRRSLTDTIKSEIVDKTENENTKKFAYSQFSILINKSLGLPPKTDRSKLDAETLEKIAHRENLVQSLLAEHKNYSQIKEIINNL